MIAEKIVIGCLLMGASPGDAGLEPEMFTDPLYRDVYREYLKGYENHKEVTQGTLENALVSDQRPRDFLQRELAECVDAMSTTVEIRPNAEAIRKAHIARKAEEAINRTLIKPNTVYEDVGGLIHGLEALTENREVKATAAADMVDRFKGMYFTDKPEGVSTGFRELDDTIGELCGGDMIVIGARPAVGKSALVTQIATHISSKGKRVGFYNLEMQDQQIYERIVASESGISLQRIKRAVAFTGDEKVRFDRANARIKEAYKNLIVNTGAKKVSDIRAESRHMEYDIIIIDYMQLLLPEDRYKGNRFAEVGQISHEIKALAMELNIPIIALSQLNRVSEAKETKEPSMAELRESGDVEQDASIIMLMWNLTDDRQTKGLKVDKNRQGKVGKEALRFAGDTMRFVESEWEEAEEEIPVFR